MSRPAIPRPLERQVLVEAGHRCAIPACGQTPVEIVHIEPWAQVREHTFENLIALCPTCHTRYDRREIDRLAMRRYKANLSIVNGRYGDLERRVLEAFATLAPGEGASIVLPRSLSMLMLYLTRDGLVDGEPAQTPPHLEHLGPDDPSLRVYQETMYYRLTEKGAEFVQRWLQADELD